MGIVVIDLRMVAAPADIIYSAFKRKIKFDRFIFGCIPTENEHMIHTENEQQDDINGEGLFLLAVEYGMYRQRTHFSPRPVYGNLHVNCFLHKISCLSLFRSIS